MPSLKSIEGGGYGSIPANNPVGAEAGKQLVDRTVRELRDMWDK
ncbi:hypothetical protein ACFFNY_32650 [Paenibacillus hodogayensis]|uniref:Uncharacterized protein n=1 Tax=Paenibacillus hodogayensis TaxID=279208 RepID=A0ABV5W7J7_9BACL